MSDAFEVACEVALVCEATENSGLRNRHPFGKFGFGTRDSQLDEVFVRRQPDVLFESSTDVNPADLRQFGERIQCEGIQIINVQKIFYPRDKSGCQFRFEAG